MGLQFFFALLCSACVAGTATAGDVDFKRDVVPIFKTSCVMCHLPGTEAGGLALHPRGGYSNLVGTQVAAGGAGERMPFGESQLSKEQIDTIRRWIKDGAKAD